MERIVNQVAEQLLKLWYSSTPTDYLWLGATVLFVGWIVSQSTQPNYS